MFSIHLYVFLLSSYVLARTFDVVQAGQGQAPSQHLDKDKFQVVLDAEQPTITTSVQSARITSTNICNHTSRAFTGYVDFRDRHIFFYYFESLRNPKKDDVIFWTNGGPGCSAAVGLFQELGPCTLRDSKSLPSHNPYSWNSIANVIFVDQPVGTGFSYSDQGEPVHNTDDAAVDVAEFVTLFFEAFPDLKGRSFHLSGESYAGGYLPVFAAKILDTNSQRAAAGYAPINLKSVIIGNGISDISRQVPAWYEIQCTHASGVPFQSIQTCVRMKKALPRCESLLKQSCVDIFDEVACGAAENFCSTELVRPFMMTGRNPYDVRINCDGDSALTLCYPVARYIENYLNNPLIRTHLGVDPDFGAFNVCSLTIKEKFESQLDSFRRPTHEYVAALLDRDIRVLIFAGVHDWRCNWVGNDRFTAALQWHGQADFVREMMRPWIVDGVTAGLTRGTQGLTFATVDGAGHMVSYDKPAQALYMIQRWLSGKNI